MTVTGRFEQVGDIRLRLVRRDSGGYWVRRDGGRTLGAIWRHRSRWYWVTSSNAFRGDGRPGLESDGRAADTVSPELGSCGEGTRRCDVCADLVDYLRADSAPVLGFGPHPSVTVRESVNV